VDSVAVVDSVASVAAPASVVAELLSVTAGLLVVLSGAAGSSTAGRFTINAKKPTAANV